MAAEVKKEKHEEKTIPFYPDQVRREALTAYLVFLAMVLIAVVLPPHLGDRADPMDTPAHIKPEWYFLFLYQFIKFVPPEVGVMVPLLAVVAVTFLPFLDRTGDTDQRQRRLRLMGAAAVGIVVLALTVWGYTS